MTDAARALPLYGASFGQALTRFFTKYATFSGRASRSEFWWSWLFFFIVVLALAIPRISVTVRRLHDANYSGWMFLLALIPQIGGLIVLILTLLPSNPEGARFDVVVPPSPVAVGAPTA